MDIRDFLRGKKAVEQVQNDLERRKRGRQEYRPNRRVEPPYQVQPAPPPPSPPQQVPTAYIIQQKTGFSKRQTCVLVILAIILTTVCVCGGLLSAPYLIGPPPSPLFQPTSASVTAPGSVTLATRRPDNQTREGLIFADVRLMPFTPDNPIVKPGQGNFWRLEVTVQNPTNKPLNLQGYDIILRDQQGREFWYDSALSMFGVKDGFVQQLNPGTTIIMGVVYDLPEQIAGGLTMHYDGAVVLISSEQIVR